MDDIASDLPTNHLKCQFGYLHIIVGVLNVSVINICKHFDRTYFTGPVVENKSLVLQVTTCIIYSQENEAIYS